MTGKWIWTARHSKDEHNQTAVFRNDISVELGASARIAITADSWYRLRINGKIVNDGPARGWPSHYKYDSMDITSYLRSGENQIEVLAKYFGTGTFHQIPQRPGLLAEMKIENAGETTVVATDRTWRASPAHEWRADTPKISIQMEPFEYYDAGSEGLRIWEPAFEICGAHDGPWQDLAERDCALLTWEPVSAKAVMGAQTISTEPDTFCFGVARMAHPGLVEAQNNTAMPLGAAMVIRTDAAKNIAVASATSAITRFFSSVPAAGIDL